MSTITACRHCGESVTLADGMTGLTVRCPHCKLTFVAGAMDLECSLHAGPAPQPTPLPTFHPQPRPQERSIVNPTSSPWRHTAVGLQLMYTSAGIVAFTCSLNLTAFILGNIGFFVRFPQLKVVHDILLAFSPFAVIVALVCLGRFLLGVIQCKHTPDASARGANIACLIALTISWIIPVCGGFLTPRSIRGHPSSNELPLNFTALTILAAALSLIVYLRCLAKLFGAHRLAVFAACFFVFTTVTWTAFALIPWYAEAHGMTGMLGLHPCYDPYNMWLIRAILGAIVPLATMFGFMYLLRQTRNLVDTHIAKSEQMSSDASTKSRQDIS